VALDIRTESKTLGQWFGIHLSAENKKQLWIPPGFAHGFLVVSDHAEFLYKTTDYWYPEFEQSVRWNDPDLNIDWPMLNDNSEKFQPSLAKKDSAAKSWREIQKDLHL
jgi:dTDP-4-dehydrorhamnose 3,5-epimerase